MDPVVLSSLLGGLGGCLVSWALIFAFYKVGGKLGERIVSSSVVSDRHLTPMFGDPISDWKSAFAWKPVHTLDEGYVWLKRYWRRRIHKHHFLNGGSDFWWQNLVTLTFLPK